MRLRLALGLAVLVLFFWVFLTARPVAGCPAPRADRSAIVVVDPGATGPVELKVDGFDGDEDLTCFARLRLWTSQLPSLRLAPRPVELAEAVGPVAHSWGLDRCAILVEIQDDIGIELDPLDRCWWGLYRYDGTSPWPESSDQPCR